MKTSAFLVVVILMLVAGIRSIGVWPFEKPKSPAELAELAERNKARALAKAAKKERELEASMKPAEPTAYEAYLRGKQLIEKALNDPDSAKFSDRFFIKRKDGLFEVGGVVRARNGFGGMVQNPWRMVTDKAYVVTYFRLGDEVQGDYVPDQG